MKGIDDHIPVSVAIPAVVVPEPDYCSWGDGSLEWPVWEEANAIERVRLYNLSIQHPS